MGKRGRPKGSRNRTRLNREYISVLLLTCNECGKEYAIRTGNKEAYTDKIKQGWVCIVCK